MAAAPTEVHKNGFKRIYGGVKRISCMISWYFKKDCILLRADIYALSEGG